MGANAGWLIQGVVVFFVFAIYLAIVVFGIVMTFRFVRAAERIARAQERRAEVAERTGHP